MNPGVLIGPSSQTPSPSATRSPTTTPSPTTTTSPKGGVPLGSHGVSLTPAPGWTITQQDSNSVHLLSSDKTADIYITVGPAQSTDITQVLSADIQKRLEGVTGVQVVHTAQPEEFHGQNFNRAVTASYQGTWSTQQGTTPIFGVFAELLNTSSGQSAFIDYSANSIAALNAHTAEADSMTNSLG